MSLRFGEHYNGGIYHIFNRGTDKRVIFNDKQDKDRFCLLLELLNSTQNIGSMRELLEGDLGAKREKLAQTPLVRIVAYSLQGNHFHLLLEQLEDSGIQRFMQKLGMAYAKYFNDKNNRTGVLFEGRYKYIWVQSKHQIMRLICYINRNEVIHGKQPKNEYSSRHWYIQSGSVVGLEKYQNMFGDYTKQEEDVIDQIKSERNIDDKHDKENLLE